MPSSKTPKVFEKIKHPYMQNMPCMHYHEKHELYYLIEGSTKYFIEDELFVLKPGDFIFIPKNVYHKTRSDAERILLHFDDTDFGEREKKYLAELFSNKHIVINNKHKDKLLEIIYKIEKEEEKKRVGYQDMQKLYISELLILFSRYREDGGKENFSPTYQLVQDVAKYISENYADDLSLQRLSEKFNITPNYLSKQFKKLTDVALSDYINLTRISAAEKLLVTTDFSITEISMQCGFNDSNYFAAVFKKIKGITPKKYSMINK